MNMTLFTAPRNLLLGDLEGFGEGTEGPPTA